MFYKEWQRTRLKFGVMLVLYAFAGLLVNTVFAPKLHDAAGHSVFQFWIVAAIAVTLGAGLLGGVDAIAEENDRGTIGFLLSRPVSRRQVYTIKILLNSLALAFSLAISSLVIFFTQLIPRFFTANIWDTEKGAYLPVPVPDPFIPPLEALSDVMAILGLGVMLVCLSTFVSIFARSTIAAICWTTLLISLGFFIAYGFIILLVAPINLIIDETTIFDHFYKASFQIWVVLSAVATISYLLGVQLFKGKQF